MKPLESELRLLVGQWVKKAAQDLATATHLAGEGAQFREAVAFHAQQAVEKYLKALLVRHQVEFPKTHDIRQLLNLLHPLHSKTADALRDTEWLSPFGVEIRYPGDTPEMLPGEEGRAVELAGRVRDRVMALLAGYLGGE